MKKSKIRTHKSLSKKVRITGSGKMMSSHQLRSGHLRRNKSKQTLRRHAVPKRVSQTLERTFRRMLGK